MSFFIMEGRAEEPTRAPVRLDRLSAAERMRFAGDVRSLRRAAGMTQEALASAAGVDRRTIGNLERGAFAPQADVLRRVLRVLGVSIDDDEIDAATAQWLAVIAALVERVPQVRREVVMSQVVDTLAAELGRSRDVGGSGDDLAMTDLQYAADLGNTSPDEDLRAP